MIFLNFEFYLVDWKISIFILKLLFQEFCSLYVKNSLVLTDARPPQTPVGPTSRSNTASPAYPKTLLYRQTLQSHQTYHRSPAESSQESSY